MFCCAGRTKKNNQQKTTAFLPYPPLISSFSHAILGFLITFYRGLLLLSLIWFFFCLVHFWSETPPAQTCQGLLQHCTEAVNIWFDCARFLQDYLRGTPAEQLHWDRNSGQITVLPTVLAAKRGKIVNQDIQHIQLQGLYLGINYSVLQLLV